MLTILQALYRKRNHTHTQSLHGRGSCVRPRCAAHPPEREWPDAKSVFLNAKKDRQYQYPKS